METTERAWLKELLTTCPFGSALDSCPAKGIRELLLYDRFKVMNEMSDEEVEAIIDYHKVCRSEREKLNM